MMRDRPGGGGGKGDRRVKGKKRKSAAEEEVLATTKSTNKCYAYSTMRRTEVVESLRTLWVKQQFQYFSINGLRLSKFVCWENLSHADCFELVVKRLVDVGALDRIVEGASRGFLEFSDITEKCCRFQRGALLDDVRRRSSGPIKTAVEEAWIFPAVVVDVITLYHVGQVKFPLADGGMDSDGQAWN
jgi:hypothetical protein